MGHGPWRVGPVVVVVVVRDGKTQSEARQKAENNQINSPFAYQLTPLRQGNRTSQYREYLRLVKA